MSCHVFVWSPHDGGVLYFIYTCLKEGLRCPLGAVLRLSSDHSEELNDLSVSLFKCFTWAYDDFIVIPWEGRESFLLVNSWPGCRHDVRLGASDVGVDRFCLFLLVPSSSLFYPVAFLEGCVFLVCLVRALGAFHVTVHVWVVGRNSRTLTLTSVRIT